MDPAIDVGGLALPVPAGTGDAHIVDPSVSGLLDFGAYLIKWALDQRLTQLQGPTNGNPITDACPTANRYPFNPETTHVRLPKPALFAWWDGDSQVSQWTTIYGVRKRTIKLLYLFPEVVLPGGMTARAGLPAVVDACFAKLANERYHPDYGYDGAPDGTDIATSLNLIDLRYTGGQQGMMFEVPGNTTVADQGKTGGHVQRGYPSLLGSFQVWEKVGVTAGVDPTDVALDTLVDIRTNEQGDLSDTMLIHSGYLPATDGSETP